LIVQEVLNAWDSAVSYVTSGHRSEFLGRRKEVLVFQHMRRCLDNVALGFKVALNVPYKTWKIDLVVGSKSERVAVEGKFKLHSDGAVPDNRKAAFYDLFKLEQYVINGGYSGGIFVWLTDMDEYTRPATGDSRDFSTHDGRIYLPGTFLNAVRCRDKMPLPLVLTRRHEFVWRRTGDSSWRSLAMVVQP
jgi:hypothetical protein